MSFWPRPCPATNIGRVFAKELVSDEVSIAGGAFSLRTVIDRESLLIEVSAEDLVSMDSSRD